jgi:predicted nucleotidyltransferase
VAFAVGGTVDKSGCLWKVLENTLTPADGAPQCITIGTSTIATADEYSLPINAASHTLVVHGRIYCTGVDNASDERIKNELDSEGRSALAAICQIKIKRWLYKPEISKQLGLPEDVQIGPFAQELQKVIPEAVRIAGDLKLDVSLTDGHGNTLDEIKGFLVVDYKQLSMMNIKAVQELNTVTVQLREKHTEVETEYWQFREETQRKFDEVGEDLDAVKRDVSAHDTRLATLEADATTDFDRQPNRLDKHGYGKLHNVAKCGNISRAKLLIDSKANINLETDTRMESPLHIAAANQHVEMVRVLLENGANPGAETQSGWLPLHNALKCGNRDIVLIIMKEMIGCGMEDKIVPNPTKSHDHENDYLLQELLDILKVPLDAPRPLKEGDRVELHGLEKTKFNGLMGTVISLNDELTRWKVHVDTLGNKKILVKMKNLLLKDRQLMSALVLPDEALVFEKFSLFLQCGAHTMPAIFGEQFERSMRKQMKTIEDTIASVLDLDRGTVIAQMVGSKMKGTDHTGSDIDIIVRTGRIAVSHEQKNMIAEELKKASGFHREHVQVKCLAIGCMLDGKSVDIVVGNSEEYGEISERLASLFSNNLPAQNAARVLKVAMLQSSGETKPPTLPSFIFEAVVLEALELKDSNDSSVAGIMTSNSPIGDGSFQLFCDALQLLVDLSDGEAFVNVILKWVELGELTECTRSKAQRNFKYVWKHTRVLIRNFLLSRIYQNGRGMAHTGMLMVWTHNYGSDQPPALDTPFGSVPAVIMVHDASMKTLFGSFANLHSMVGGDPNRLQTRTLQQCQEAIDAAAGSKLETEILHGEFFWYSRDCSTQNSSNRGPGGKEGPQCPDKCDITQLACWTTISELGYQPNSENVMIVDSSGSGHFKSFDAAIRHAQRFSHQDVPDWHTKWLTRCMGEAAAPPRSCPKMLIIVLSGSYNINVSARFDMGPQINIVGIGRVDIVSQCTTDSAFRAIGKETMVCIENLSINLSGSNKPCIYSSQGATVEVRGCFIGGSPDSGTVCAYCMVAQDAELQLFNSKCKGRATAVLADSGGRVSADGCKFSGCRDGAAIAVRNSAHGKFTSCEIRNCTQQGFIMYLGSDGTVPNVHCSKTVPSKSAEQLQYFQLSMLWRGNAKSLAARLQKVAEMASL